MLPEPSPVVPAGHESAARGNDTLEAAPVLGPPRDGCSHDWLASEGTLYCRRCGIVELA